MKIAFVWDGDYPWDIRVEKVCQTLISQGHEIHLICRNLARKPLEEEHKGMHLHRLPYLPKSLGRLNDAFTFPAFFSPVWLYRIISVTLKYRCDLIIVRDLPMGLAGTFSARVARIPCVLDMAECYPEMLRCTWEFEGGSVKNYILRNPKLADLVEKAVLKRVKQVWVMIEESRDRLLRLGVPREKIKVISNTPVLARFGQDRKSRPFRGETKDKKKLRLIYVGLLNPSRGLDTTIRAVGKYIKKNPDFEFIVVGRGKAEAKLQEMASDLKLDHCVRFLGWVENSQVPALIADADIGIVPHHKCSHWDNTIPNKLFDYMAAEKPVIVSNVAPMARIVKETNCGMVYTDLAEDELVKVFCALEDPALRDEKGRAGKTAVTGSYNWGSEEIILMKAIEEIRL